MLIRPFDAKKDLPQICSVYQKAFAGFPWFENLSNEEVQTRIQRHINLPGFEGLVAEKDLIVGAHWWDCPNPEDLLKERGVSLAEFVQPYITMGYLLIWERELLTHPDYQGRGIGTKLRTEFVKMLAKYRQKTIVLTRMREDNLPTIKIAQRLGYLQTGVKSPCSIKPDTYHEYWYLA